MKIIDFIKNNKVPTIATSVVLVAAIAVGVIFGVMKHKDNVEAKPSEVKTSSAESSSEVSSVVKDSSSEVTSSVESVSSVVSETEPVSSAQTSSVAQTSSKPVSSASSNVVSSKPVTSTPSNTTSSKPATSTPANSGGNTGISTKWVCPDPAAHGGSKCRPCVNEQDHNDLVRSYEDAIKIQKEEEERVASEKANGTWVDTSKYCITCHRPLGDGHNGTCRSHLENGKWTCEYDY